MTVAFFGLEEVSSTVNEIVAVTVCVVHKPLAKGSYCPVEFEFDLRLTVGKGLII